MIKMKMNWGFGIALVTTGFVVFILSLVYRCSNEKVELVSERYYENELKYQDRIDRKNNLSRSGGIVHVDQVRDTVRFTFPATGKKIVGEGTIAFYRPDDAAQDFAVPVRTDSNAVQWVAVAACKKGRWQVQVTWEDQDVPYYSEQDIVLN